MTGEKLQYSVVMPVFQAAAYIESSVRRVVAVMEGLGQPYELILVDDCSTDNTLQLIQQLKYSIPTLRVLQTERNIGQTPATLCGAEHARGELVITLDDDMQHPPEEIPKLISAYQAGSVKVLFGDPSERVHPYSQHKWLVALGRFLFHAVYLRPYKDINFFTTFRLFEAGMLEKNGGTWSNLFFIWQLNPKEVSHVATKHEPRSIGSTNHSLGKLIRHFSPFLWYFLKLTLGWGLVAFIGAGIATLAYALLQGRPVLNNWTTIFLISIIFLNALLFVVTNRLNNLANSEVNSIEV